MRLGWSVVSGHLKLQLINKTIQLGCSKTHGLIFENLLDVYT